MTLSTILVGLLIAILAEEILGWLPCFAKWLVRRNAKYVPSHLMSRCEEEWQAHIDEIPGRVSKLFFAIDTYRASYRVSRDYVLSKERITGKTPLDQMKPSWSALGVDLKSLGSRKIVKRILDFTLAIVCLIISSPVMLLTAAIIKLESHGPVLFKQIRIGEYGKEFYIYGFRSVRQGTGAASGSVWAGAVDNRVTNVGKVLRKIGVDELPLLINVLKGDMSFVGPYPERQFFVQKLKEEIPYYEMRTAVKPGITGWAQIKYPYGTSARDALEKLKYDIYYIKNMSPLLDLMIFFSTIKVVLTGRATR